MYIGIIADDLTGAADSAAPFARGGLRAHVGLFCPEDLETDVLAIDTGTRDAAGRRPTLLASKVRRITRHLLRREPRLLYKKIDSTLRGNLRLELDAIRRELPGRLAVVCPAFPANGRTVQSGVLSIQGIPWTETVFAPQLPLEFPTVRAAFVYSPEANAADIPLSVIRQGAEALEATIVAQGPECEAVFCDAETPDDLDILAETLQRRPERYLPVGSAGLADALAARLHPAVVPQPTQEPLIRGRALVVVGSRHPASRRQAEYLAALAGIQPLIYENDSKKAFQEAQAQFVQGQRIVLLMTPEHSLQEPWLGFTADILLWGRRTFGDFGLVVTGGATARQILEGCRGGLRIVGESEPGVALGEIFACWQTHEPLIGMPIVLKAGGFGMDETLFRVVG